MFHAWITNQTHSKKQKIKKKKGRIVERPWQNNKNKGAKLKKMPESVVPPTNCLPSPKKQKKKRKKKKKEKKKKIVEYTSPIYHWSQNFLCVCVCVCVCVPLPAAATVFS